jgi:hypothetical protein
VTGPPTGAAYTSLWLGWVFGWNGAAATRKLRVLGQLLIQVQVPGSELVQPRRMSRAPEGPDFRHRAATYFCALLCRLHRHRADPANPRRRECVAKLKGASERKRVFTGKKVEGRER